MCIVTGSFYPNNIRQPANNQVATAIGVMPACATIVRCDVLHLMGQGSDIGRFEGVHQFCISCTGWMCHGSRSFSSLTSLNILNCRYEVKGKHPVSFSTLFPIMNSKQCRKKECAFFKGSWFRLPRLADVLGISRPLRLQKWLNTTTKHSQLPLHDLFENAETAAVSLLRHWWDFLRSWHFKLLFWHTILNNKNTE